ncbi:MAG: O-antigen ligase family protein [Hyphomicrobiaceae bacterium]
MNAHLASVGRKPVAAQSARSLNVSLETLGRIGVLIAMAFSGLVFTEPAPVDALFIGLAIVLPFMGVTRLSPVILGVFSLWLLCGIGALIASSDSMDVSLSMRHTGVSIDLSILVLLLASFIAADPERHARLIFKGWVLAAIVAALAALAGYFTFPSGAFDVFTKYGRATGTFKDPNVLGPFLIPAIAYLIGAFLDRQDVRGKLLLIPIALMIFAVLLSFSRGAWFQLILTLGKFGLLRLVSERSRQKRIRMVLIGTLAIMIAAGGLITLIASSDKIGSFIEERSSLTQEYDVGPQGRFGGQAKALDLAIQTPLGIGAGVFSEHYHPEDVHNVYLSMFLNAGWLGGLAYLAATAATVVVGFLYCFSNLPGSNYLFIGVASFTANVAEGAIIDTDHWRNFYILMALVWGLIGASLLQKKRVSL